MKFRDQLEKIEACDEALDWVGNKSLEQAWKTCKNSEWMIWILARTDLDLTDPVCDIAERVLDLVPEDIKLVCKKAIIAAKSRADKDELDAASTAASSAAVARSEAVAAGNAADDANDFDYAITAAYAVASAAEYCAAARSASNDSFSADDAVSNAAYAYAASYDASYDADEEPSCYAFMKEKKKQCDILRKYFTIDQVREAFNKLVA